MDRVKSVSIIIPAKNEERMIGRCLESIRSLHAAPEMYEIIVVDNGSSDKTILITQSYGAKVLSEPRGTIAFLRNIGAKYSTGNILAFLDADCLVADEWLTAALEEFKDEKVGAAGCNYSLQSRGTWVEETTEFSMKEKEARSETDWIQSGNLFIRREVFELVGGFDQNLRVCEDSDICYRIKDLGYKVISNEKIKNYHLGFCKDLPGFFKKELWYGKDFVRLFLKHLKRRRYLGVMLYTCFFFVCLSALAIGIVMKHAFGLLGAVLLMIGVPLIVSFRKNLQKGTQRYIFQLALLYFLFGVARASSLLTFSNLNLKSHEES